MEPPRSYKGSSMQCNATFKELKQYLGSPKLLTKPEDGEEVQLYLVVSDGAISSVLLRKEREVQKPIYYVSHVLHRPEENYPVIDKFVLALVTSARKLKDYFEAHPIKVMIDQPIKRVLSNPAQSLRLTTWAIELSEFEMKYAPRSGIKAQVLADFVLENSTSKINEAPNLEEIPEVPKWTLYVDGASNDKGAGAGILIQGENGEQFEYALHFSFKVNNNEAKYETMVTGLQMAEALDINRLKVRGDSKLFIEQVRRDCGVKNDTLKKYHTKALLSVQGFEYVIFEHIPRAQNEHADHLSRLATTYFDEIPSHMKVEVRNAPTYEEVVIMRIMEEEEDWRSPIVRFILKGEFPNDGVEARKIKS
ncbi:hypothetical protein LIER_15739 [Lithospermum erythrorhizon]|uniref:RNase H type-1 domain-containing protein n=1 Tax=Lithospermum erythrorhizon TaxID=34254 RepID=A0AAV3Q421_LITER